MNSFKKYHAMTTGIGIRSDKYHTVETVMGDHSREKKIEEEFHGHDNIKDITKKEEKDIDLASSKTTHENVGRLSSLSKSHRYCIDKYTADSSMINKKLHQMYGGNDEALDEHDKSFIKGMDSLLDSHQTHEDSMVFTGLKRSPHEAFHYTPDGEKLANPHTHANIHLPAYTSTSSSFRVAALFARNSKPVYNDESKDLLPDFKKMWKKNSIDPAISKHHGEDLSSVERHVLAIHLPEGSKAQSIRHVSSAGDAEQEVLLHRGHTLEVHKTPTVVEHSGQKYAVWHANIVDHDPMDIK